MIIVETPFHITFSTKNSLPIKYCTGSCSKVFLDDKSACDVCGGTTETAFEDTHYKILSRSIRDLIIADFKITHLLSESELNDISSAIDMGAKIDHLSVVKPEFESKAKAEWLGNK